MTTERHARLPGPGVAENGRPTCRLCQKEVPKGRRSFCSAACGEEALIRSSSSYARAAVEKRDKGVCALCGADTEYIRKIIEPLLREAYHLINPRPFAWEWRTEDQLPPSRYAEGAFEKARALREIADAWLREWLGPGKITGVLPLHGGERIATHLWEMDHIVPVIHGGGACGLENLRTLCRPCHDRETKKLAGLRAKTKRLQAKEREHRERMAAK